MRRELILLQRAWRGISALLDDDAKSCRILSRTDQSHKVVTQRLDATEQSSDSDAGKLR